MDRMSSRTSWQSPAGPRRHQDLAKLCYLAEPNVLVRGIREPGAQGAGDLRELHEPLELACGLNRGHCLFYTTLGLV